MMKEYYFRGALLKVSAFVQKIKDNKKIVLLSLFAFIEIIDLSFLSLLTNKRFFYLSQVLLVKFEFSSLHFRPNVYANLVNIFSYILSFVLGGLLVFTVLKLVSKLALALKLFNYESLTLIPLALCLIVTFIGCLASKFNPQWFAPFLTYLGGLLMFFLSSFRLKLEA